MKYFKHSQKIRKEIESDQGILDKIKDFNRRTIIGKRGLTSTVYRIGRLESGLYVAARENTHRFFRKWIERQHENLESYAQNAEALSEAGEDTVSFCVGVQIGEKPLLLVEDLTAGGRYDLICLYDSPKGDVKTHTQERLVKRKIWGLGTIKKWEKSGGRMVRKDVYYDVHRHSDIPGRIIKQWRAKLKLKEGDLRYFTDKAIIKL